MSHIAPVLTGSTMQPLRPATTAGFNPCNPGILRIPGGYLVVCRAVRFAKSRRRSLDGPAPELIRSRNIVMRLNADLEVVDQRPVTIDEPPLRRGAIQGLEDCRVFAIRGKIFLTCTTADRHPSGQLHMSVCRLEPDGRITLHRPLVGAFDDRTQKNWLPFVAANGIVRAVYEYNPLTILRLCVESGRYEVEAQVPHAWDAAGWRGSAGPVRLPGTRKLLILVHEVVPRPAHEPRLQRAYLHRFVECDSRFRITRVSRPFVFAHHGIEFPCGMALSHDGTSLVIGLGIEDRRAYVCRIPLRNVQNLLRAEPDQSPSKISPDGRTRSGGPHAWRQNSRARIRSTSGLLKK